MPQRHLNRVIQQLRRAALAGDGAGMTDGQLLECFVSRRESAAIEALVQRHGPMVWGVCRRILRNHHDAEDAFQASFLVLVRKAAAVVPREMVANWLYGVVHQTARKARANAAKRRRREKQVTVMPEAEAAQEDLWIGLLPLLDRELTRLPDKYRAAVVLCDLEGKALKEAARELSVPLGTVASRLARAREMLAQRLARHGPAVPALTLATLLPRHAMAGVPASAVSATAKTLGLAVAGQTTGFISVKVAALTEGVLQTMYFSKLMRMTVLALVLELAALGGGLFTQHLVAGEENAAWEGAAPKRQDDAPNKVKTEPKGASKAEVDKLQMEIVKLRLDLEVALMQIQNLKTALGQAAPRQDQSTLYRGKPIRFWLEQLKDADPKFRGEAVDALGALAQDNKELVGVLKRALKDRNSLVRQRVAENIGVLAKNDKELIPVLAHALPDTHDFVKQTIWHALTGVGTEAVPVLMEILQDKTSAQAVAGAATALGRIGRPAKAAASLLAQTLKMEDENARNCALSALAAIGPDAKSAIPALIEYLGSLVKSEEINVKQGTFRRQRELNMLQNALVQIDPETRDILRGIRPDLKADSLARRWQQAYEDLKRRYQKEQ